MPETWYVMEDGSFGDPREVRLDKDGQLAHKDGRKVAYAPHGPRTRSIDPDRAKAKAQPKARSDEPKADEADVKDIKPEEPKRGYRTRESKAD